MNRRDWPLKFLDSVWLAELTFPDEPSPLSLSLTLTPLSCLISQSIQSLDSSSDMESNFLWTKLGFARAGFLGRRFESVVLPNGACFRLV